MSLLAVSNANESYVAQFSHLCNIPDAINDIKAANHLTDEQITGNTPLLSIQGQIEGKSGVNQIYQVAFILSLIVMLTCILMISSSLNSNVAERTEFFGMLRCLGATKRQIMRFVCLEGLYWCTETFFCSEATFSALTGETGYTIIDIQFENNASSEDVNAIKNIFTNGGVIFSDSLSQVQQQRNLYYTFAVLVYGFLSIIVAITIFHIMNTINLGVAAKMKEYGSMRAIGMSNRQLIKMIIAEAGTYAISGVIWGCIIGLPMHWVIYVSLITNIWGTAWSVPFIPLILIIAIVLLTSLLAVKGPAKRLQRMSIVENISAQ